MSGRMHLQPRLLFRVSFRRLSSASRSCFKPLNDVRACPRLASSSSWKGFSIVVGCEDDNVFFSWHPISNRPLDGPGKEQAQVGLALCDGAGSFRGVGSDSVRTWRPNGDIVLWRCSDPIENARYAIGRGSVRGIR